MPETSEETFCYAEGESQGPGRQRLTPDKTVRINPPTLFWIQIAAIAGADRFLPLVRFDEPWLTWIGAELVIMGAVISVAGKIQFRRVGTNVYTFGKPGQLVTGGLYRVSRNPMYLGLVMAGIGAALVSGTLMAALVSAAFAATVRFWYIAFEEDAMRRQFSDEYEAYRRRVPRWLGRQRSVE